MAGLSSTASKPSLSSCRGERTITTTPSSENRLIDFLDSERLVKVHHLRGRGGIVGTDMAIFDVPQRLAGSGLKTRFLI
jgi:hypothetical protein